MKVQKFIKKLKMILDKEDANIIDWGDDNSSFEIYDISKFEAEILPKYFKTTKFSSFQRQLNYFKFKKLTKTKTKNCAFHNPNFNKYNDNYLKFLDKNYYYVKKGLRDSLVDFYTSDNV